MNSQQMMEEIDRLTRLCEEKDAEIKKLEGILSLKDTLAENMELQLSESQAQIAMLHDLLTRIGTYPKAGAWTNHEVLKAITATSETVAAWRAKETDPLRREVAMLHEFVEHKGSCAKFDFGGENGVYADSACTCGLSSLLNDTQATALAYEREVETRGAVKALEELMLCVENIAGDKKRLFIYHSDWIDILKDKVTKLRAENKGLSEMKKRADVDLQRKLAEQERRHRDVHKEIVAENAELTRKLAEQTTFADKYAREVLELTKLLAEENNLKNLYRGELEQTANQRDELTKLIAEAKSKAVPEDALKFIEMWSGENKHALTQHDQGARWACIELKSMLAAAPQPETDRGSNE